MKKYLLGLGVALLAAVVAVVGFHYVRERMAAPKPEAPSQEDELAPGSGQGGGRGRAKTGEIKVSVIRDGQSVRELTRRDLEAIQPEPSPVLTRAVQAGWELRKVLPELKTRPPQSVEIFFADSPTLRISAAELKDPKRVFFLFIGRRGDLRLAPIDYRKAHKIKAGYKMPGIKKAVLGDLTRVEIYSGNRSDSGKMAAAGPITAPMVPGVPGSGQGSQGLGRGDGRGWDGRGPGPGTGQFQGGGPGGGQGQGRGGGRNRRPGQNSNDKE